MRSKYDGFFVGIEPKKPKDDGTAATKDGAAAKASKDGAAAKAPEAPPPQPGLYGHSLAVTIVFQPGSNNIADATLYVFQPWSSIGQALHGRSSVPKIVTIVSSSINFGLGNVVNCLSMSSYEAYLSVFSSPKCCKFREFDCCVDHRGKNFQAKESAYSSVKHLCLFVLMG